MKLYRAGEHTVSELEELFAVTRSTIYRAIARAGERTALAPAGDMRNDNWDEPSFCASSRRRSI